MASKTKRDYTIVEAPFPTMKAMLQEKEGRPRALCAAVLVRSAAQADRAAVVLQQRRVGVSQVHHLGARQSFIDKNRAAMVDSWKTC